MTDAASRARRRRAEWSGGKVASFDELAELDLDGWLLVPPAERLGMVFDMWFEQARPTELEDNHEAAPRLQRSVGGVRPRRS